MNSYLVSGLAMTPAVLERVLSKIPQEKLNKPTGEDRFAPKEIFAHLADWEPIFLARLHQTLEDPGSVLEVYDEGEMAEAHEYSKSDLTEQLAKFRDRRRETVEFIKKLGNADWHKSAKHPERGDLTIGDQVGLLLGHDMYHIEQLSACMEG